MYAQESKLSGKVTDLSDKPIIGAVITIKNTNRNVATDENGHFNFQKLKVASYNLCVSMVGYESKETKIECSTSNDSLLIIKLKDVIEDLEAVVVTGTRTEKKLKDVPILTQVVYAQKLKEMGITTVGEALERELPGLDFNVAQNSLRPSITFQGMNSKYILILIDGERVAGEMNGSIDFARLNLDNVERIEVVRGASSALYGSNAIGGVINIITKRPVVPLEISVNSRYSKFNELSSGITVGMKSAVVASLTNIVYNQSDGYDLNPKVVEGNRTQEPFGNISANQKFEFYPLQKLTITTNGGGYYNRLFNGTYNRPADSAYSGVFGNAKAIYVFNDSNKISLSYSSDYYTTYSVLYNQNDMHIQSATDYLQSVKLLGNFGQRKNILTFGFEYLPERLKSGRIIGNSHSAYDVITFLQSDYKISSTVSVVAGARLTKNSIYGLSFVPKISLMARHDNLISRFSVGLGFRAPALKELYYDFNHFGMFTIEGNVNLKPEKSQYVGYSIEMNQSKLSHSVNIYYNHITDLIAFKQINSTTFQNMNDSSANIIGIDLMERVMLFKGFVAGAGISLVDARNSISGRQLYNFNPVSANINFNYAANFFSKHKTSFDLQGKYTGFRTYEPTNTLALSDKPYSIFKASVTQYYKRILTLTLGVDNILNTVNSMSFDNTSPGRRYFISLNYNFSRY